MPELPEVETVVRDLRPGLLGRKIVAVHVSPQPLRLPWRKEWEPVLLGQTFRVARRRGKWICLELDEPYFLIIHLGMTGQLTVTSAHVPWRDHTHVVFTLDQGRQLRYRDIRRFGSCQLLVGEEAVTAFFHQNQLGPEPFDLDPNYWRRQIQKTNRCLKAVLLDQRVVAGVGNIYADEALHEARLHPTQLGRATTRAEAERLRRAVAIVLTRAIEQRGSSIRDYVGGSGLKGQYQEEFRVYSRTGAPCPRCWTAIQRIRRAGRATHFCPKCQQLKHHAEK
ncbi:MAG: bifunctional DNA-formamidopyrimidine glycosylase/DNA-(apurinic or apyrimidinic site) lyase [Gemmataceae bacterium]